MIRKLISDIQDFSESVSKKNISAFSASTAFFLFLSLIPMLILICAILPYTSLTEDILLEAIIKYTPETVEGLVTGIVADVYSRSAGVVSVAAIGTLWSAGKGVLALMRGLNAVNDVEENRNYFVVRTVASFYTLIMIVVIILSLLLMVFGNLLVNLLLKDFPRVRLVIEFFMNFRFIFSWAVLTMIFTMIYTFMPNRKMHFFEQLTGGMFAAVVWSIFSWCFSMYVDRFEGLNTYGSLTTIVIIMLYFYFCMYIILIGAYINSYFIEKGGVKQKLEEFKEVRT